MKATNVNYDKMNTKSIERFLVRQIDARQRKHDADAWEQSKPGSGRSWKNKVTKPKTPRTLK